MVGFSFIMADGTGIVFNNLVWEIPDQASSENLFFNESQQRIIRAGWERHPTTAEIFDVIFACDDHIYDRGSRLNHEQFKQLLVLESVFDHFSSMHLSQAIETRQHGRVKTVLFYEAVATMQKAANIPTEEGDDLFEVGGDRSSMQYAGVREFDIRDLDLEHMHLFRCIFRRHDNMIKYLTSRFFKDLPEEIQESGGIYLPYPEYVWPLGMNYEHIFYHAPDCRSSSQGVRRVQNTADEHENRKNSTLESVF